MNDVKNRPIAMPIKIMPKQYYQRKPLDNGESRCGKALKEDFIAVEEPLQISLSYFDSTKQSYQLRKLSITMRTPGEDSELVYGFLLSEGLINNQTDIVDCEFDIEQHQGNAVCVTLAKHVQPNWQALERQFTSHSSCGICGKTSLNALQLKAPTTVAKVGDNITSTIGTPTIFKLPEILRKQQALFSQTGGLHAAGLFKDEELLFIAEDIGRHNAVDKVIGMNCLTSSDHDGGILVLTSRISFELVQKAIMANISIIVAAGAPSALAISAAQKFDLTLIGFTKKHSFNVYHGDWRVKEA